MTRYVIVALVPEPFAQPLADLRRKYDSYCRQWLPPHFTIVPPFELFLSRSDQQAIKDYRGSARVELKSWDAYRRMTTSVLYASSNAPELEAMRQELLNAVPALKPFSADVPGYHVTVVNRIPNDQFEEVRKRVVDERPDVQGSFTIDRFTLYEWDHELHHWIEVP